MQPAPKARAEAAEKVAFWGKPQILGTEVFLEASVGLEAPRDGRGYDDRDDRRPGVVGASPRASHRAGASGEAGLGAAPTPGSVRLTGRARPSVLGGGGARAPRSEEP